MIDMVGVQASPKTLDWLQDRFSVSSIFRDRIVSIRDWVVGKSGNACFCRRDGNGKVISLGLSSRW